MDPANPPKILLRTMNLNRRRVLQQYDLIVMLMGELIILGINAYTVLKDLLYKIYSQTDIKHVFKLKI